MSERLKNIRKKILNKGRAIFYKGNAVSCRVCGWNGLHFFSGNCPSCGSIPRIRLIPFSLDHFQVDLTGQNVLHIAPNALEFKILDNKYNLKSHDGLDLKVSRKFINLKEDLTRLTLKSGSYDFAICWHVLEHIEDDYKAIAEIYRILRPSGKLLLSVPIYPPGREITYEDRDIPRIRFEETHGHHDHCRSCGLDYYLRFEEAGFSTQECKVVDLDTKTIDKLGLSKSHVVWLFER